ncbi:MAG: hypothetical protein BGO50_01515 [Rhodanobacter sp. 67-28]|nr:MAG: hypothetical protein BGO50_01515 [Rhodanobacter sp. 67-28]
MTLLGLLVALVCLASFAALAALLSSRERLATRIVATALALVIATIVMYPTHGTTRVVAMHGEPAE